MFFPPLKMTFNIFNIHMIMLARQALLVDKFIHWLTTIGNHVKYVQVAININVLFWNTELY